MIVQPGGPSIGGTTPTGTSSAAIAIPPLSNGGNPKWVHVVCIQPFKAITVLFGQSGVSAATKTNGIGVDYGSGGIIINVAGNSHYRVIGVDATAIPFTVTPLGGIIPGG